ncbi:MAG: NAD(+)/NADH kinase [Sedimentisphaerales bacterium]|nr:NAD(+)/NADH kinase [Sedimentisphaerales bacterium]
MNRQVEAKKFIVVANLEKPDALELGKGLLEFLRREVNVVANNIEGRLDLGNLPEADFVTVLGGDGTILSTVRAMKDKQVPVIGVNVGKLGFLAEFSLEQMKEFMAEILADPVEISRRIMLNCCIRGPEREQEVNVMAVNELAVMVGPPFRMIEVSIWIGEEYLALCAGDGLVVATPTGSTAYNLSAGGPILYSTLEAAVITPLAAHSLNFRPVVVRLDKPIRLRCNEIGRRGRVEEAEQSESRSSAVIAIDGQATLALKREDEVIITRAEPLFQLVHNPRQSQWDLLNTKLNWGIMPNYNQDRNM